MAVIDTPFKFWLFVNKRGDDECWEWRRTTGTKYGVTMYGNRVWSTHRLAYTLVNGPIEDGMYVCHKCDNPPCCNPNHLFLGTPKDNTLDKLSKGRTRANHGQAGRPQAASFRLNDSDLELIGDLKKILGIDTSDIFRLALRTLHDKYSDWLESERRINRAG